MIENEVKTRAVLEQENEELKKTVRTLQKADECGREMRSLDMQEIHDLREENYHLRFALNNLRNTNSAEKRKFALLADAVLSLAILLFVFGIVYITKNAKFLWLLWLLTIAPSVSMFYEAWEQVREEQAQKLQKCEEDNEAFLKENEAFLETVQIRAGCVAQVEDKKELALERENELAQSAGEE